MLITSASATVKYINIDNVDNGLLHRLSLEVRLEPGRTL